MTVPFPEKNPHPAARFRAGPPYSLVTTRRGMRNQSWLDATARPARSPKRTSRTTSRTQEFHMPIYVKMEGVKGDVTAEGYTDHIQVGGLSWGVGRGVGSPVGSSKNREASAPSISEVTVSKVMDQASPQLLREALWGEGKKVEIKLVKTDKDKLEVYAEYILEDVLVSGYSISSGGDRPTENLSLNFTKIEFTNTGMGQKNETGDPDRVQYDLSLGKGA